MKNTVNPHEKTWYASRSEATNGLWRLYEKGTGLPYRVDFELWQWFSKDDALTYARSEGLRLAGEATS